MIVPQRNPTLPWADIQCKVKWDRRAPKPQYRWSQCHITNARQPSSQPFLNFSIQIYRFWSKIACIENMARIQHNQLNYQSHTCHNCDMLIKKFDLWWPKLSEVPQNPTFILAATSLAREWLAEALFRHSILTLSGWWAGGQGFQTGTAGWLCYQGQCQILEAWESVTWTLLEVIHLILDC